MSDISHSSAGPATTDDLIRSLLAEQKRVHSRNALPELAPPAPASNQAGNRRRGQKLHRQARRNPLAGLRRYRPQRRHVLWAALALVVLFYPLLLPLVLFVTLLLSAIIYLTLGPDRIVELLAGGWARLARRWPDRAERLSQRADRLALRFDALLNRLPDSWAEVLALPDLSRVTKPHDAGDDRPDPFDKLKPNGDVYRG